MPACAYGAAAQAPRGYHFGFARRWPQPLLAFIMKTCFPLLAAAACAALLSGAHAAAPTTKGQAHFLFLDAKEMPLAGVTLAGVCQSRVGPFWRATKHEARWSCTTGSDGICVADIATLAGEGGKPVECRGSERSTVTEQGAQPAKISYHAFFPKGVATSYTLLQKGTSWKDGEYLFKGVANRALFDALALRYRSGYYAQHLAPTRAADGAAVWSTQAAHAQESPDFQNLWYLRAERAAPQAEPRVRVVIELTYVDYVLHRYASAEYDGAGGRQSAALTAVSDKTTCNLRDLMERKCTYRESLEFDISAELVRQLAAKYQAGVAGNWTLRVSAPSGQQRDLPIAYAEFAALADALR